MVCLILAPRRIILISRRNTFEIFIVIRSFTIDNNFLYWANSNQMSTNFLTSLLNCRFLSHDAVQSAQAVSTQHDLITFLAIAQNARFNFLPITWQEARDMLGSGGTSRVNEAQITLHTSFAFKCITGDHKSSVPKSAIYKALASEVIALGQPFIREHPNIVELQGVCWDVTPDGEIWPVLVFEKSEFSDLYNFLTIPAGRNLCTLERLKLCGDIGLAIRDLHFHSK